MTPEKIAARGFDTVRRHASPTGSRSRRLLMIAVMLSVLVHLVPIGLLVFLPRVAPQANDFENQGTVELLMVERKGGEPSPAAHASDSPSEARTPEHREPAEPRVQAGKPEDRKPATAVAENADAPPAEQAEVIPPVANNADEAVPPPPSPPVQVTADAQKPDTRPAAARPEPPPRSPEAPVFDFAGTDSDTNAIVMSGRILPAMPDNRFRNRPPIYPLDAEMRREVGAVLVIIHVSAYGVATGADVAESSGSMSLDQAAVAAVRKWHFHPAMKEGQAVPFDMPFRFIFSAE